MLKSLIIIVILLSITACKVKSFYFDEDKASERAIEFCKYAYMLLDIEKSLDFLHAKTKSQLTNESMLEIVSKMHPYGTPTTLSTISYAPHTDKTLNVFIQGISENDTTFYLLNMNNNDSKEYMVSGFHLIIKNQFKTQYLPNSMELKDRKTVSFDDIQPKQTINLKNQLLRKKYLYKRNPETENVITLSNGHEIILEDLFQIYYASQKGWAMIMKYRSTISQNLPNEIIDESKIIWNEYFKKIAEEAAVSGAVTVALENVNPIENKNRKQYGVVYTKSESGLWEIVSKKK